MAKNKYKVHKGTWKKWPELQQRVFNEMYRFMSINQQFFIHPKQEETTREYWKTTAWNAAWIAGYAAVEEL